MHLPFEIPWSVQLDSNGNGTFTQNFANDYWYAATVSGETTVNNQPGGSPSWALRRNNVFLQPAVGSQTAMSAGVMAPGTKLTIIITAGVPNGQAAGLIYGTKSDDETELTVPLALPSSPGILNVPQRFMLLQSQTDPSPIYSVPGDGLLHTFTFPVPPGSLTIRMFGRLFSAAPVPVFNIFQILGNNSLDGGINYIYSDYSNQAGSTGANIVVNPNFRLWPFDTKLVVLLNVTSPLSTAFTFMVEASLSQDFVRAAITGDGNTSADNEIGIVDSAPIVVRNSNSIDPPPWQKGGSTQQTIAFDAAPAGGATVSVIAPVAGKTIWLQNVNYEHVATSTAFGDFRSSSGVQLGFWNQVTSAAPPIIANGTPLPIGDGLSVKNNSGVAANHLNGSINFKQL